jgi:DNA polymerase III delta prime subunit
MDVTVSSTSPTKLQWTEKYRPGSLKEVKGQAKVVTATSKFLNSSQTLPHLLFYGPPGTGKTSLIMAFLKERYGHAWGDHTLALNASDERGIAMVRSKVKTFIRYNSKIDKYVVLDEADSMTEDAQSALRRIIEGAPRTSFCIICNYKARIIEPLQSRCCAYQFEPLDPQTTLEFLQDICLKEGLKVEEEDLVKLIKATRGDLREAVGRLQNLASVLRFGGADVELVHDLVDEDLLEDLFGVLRTKIEGKREGTPVASFRAVAELWDRIVCEGHDLVSVLCSLSDCIVECQETETETETSEEPMKPADLFQALDLLSSMTDQVMVLGLDAKLVFFQLVA